MSTYVTPAPLTVVVDVPAGRVRLVAADRPDTTVEVLPEDATDGRDVTAAERTTVELTDGVLRIAAAPAPHRVLGSSGSVEVTVQLPAGSRVEVTSASTQVRGVGRLGDVVVESAQGTITLDEAASARLAVLAGDVSVGRLTGAADISTKKGHIRVAEAVRGEVRLRTDLGDVTVGAARGVPASLDAGTGYGRIENALTSTGTPELVVHATTASGDIVARSL